MAVEIRLARVGSPKNAVYRVVATERAAKRNGKFIEIVGMYNPMIEPPVIALKVERVKHWLSQGARFTDSSRAIIKKAIPGAIESLEAARLKKTQKARKARKARIAKSAKASKKA